MSTLLLEALLAYEEPDIVSRSTDLLPWTRTRPETSFRKPRSFST